MDITLKPKPVIYAFFAWLIWLPAYGETLSLQSSNRQTGLLELYTSEGCSSCPPADEWLSRLKNDPRLWKEFIPVAFHVDYWDYIGWEDRFASKDYSQRQRQYAKKGATRAVYTPGFLFNGQEWYVSRPLKLPNSQRAGLLKVDLNNQNIKVTFSPDQPADTHLEVNIAILGFNLSTSVKAGENRSRILKHDFVVLSMEKTTLKQSGDKYSVDTKLPFTQHFAQQRAVVAWVSPKNQQQPLQAVGGWLGEL